MVSVDFKLESELKQNKVVGEGVYCVCVQVLKCLKVHVCYRDTESRLDKSGQGISVHVGGIRLEKSGLLW